MYVIIYASMSEAEVSSLRVVSSRRTGGGRGRALLYCDGESVGHFVEWFHGSVPQPDGGGVSVEQRSGNVEVADEAVSEGIGVEGQRSRGQGVGGAGEGSAEDEAVGVSNDVIRVVCSIGTV